ncbi:MAG: hypothetical protein WDN24_03720 [Sphingomonas sp.]
MRSDVDHLPTIQRQELERVTAVLREEFSRAISTATQPWKKNGKILKVILFGSPRGLGRRAREWVPVRFRPVGDRQS